MEQDPFEMLLRLNKLVNGGLNSSANLKNAVSLLHKNSELRQELFSSLVDTFREEPRSRRCILALFEGLLEGSRDNYKELIGTFIQAEHDLIIESKEVSENSRRSLTKALRGLLAHFDERFEDLAERIAITLAGTEAEEQNKRLRTEALLLIEKDRESHKPLREKDWARKEEDPEEEFLQLCKEYYIREEKIKKDLLKRWDREVSTFRDTNKTASDSEESHHKRNTEAPEDKQASKRTHTDSGHTGHRRIIIFEIEDAFIKAKDFLEAGNRRTRELVEMLHAGIKDIAKELFFYKDLQVYQQPHVDYYRDEDDGRPLSAAEMRFDALARSRGQDIEGQFYRERAFRHRLAAQRHDSFHSKTSMVKGMERILEECTSCYHELDKKSHGILSSGRSAIKALVREEPDIELVSLVHGHLSLALAANLVYGYGSLFGAHKIYSSAKYGIGWVFDQLNRKYNDNDRVEFVVVGLTRDCKEACRKMNWRWLPIERTNDIDQLVQAVLQR